VSTQVQLTNM
jgi:hypothetical protein